VVVRLWLRQREEREKNKRSGNSGQNATGDEAD
jgi:hypothetical protein